MALPITFNNVTYPAGYLGTDDGAPKNTFKVDNAATYSVSINGTINKVGDTVTLTYGADAPASVRGTSITLTSTQYDNQNQILFSSTSAPPNATDPGTNWRYLLSNSQLHGKYLADGTTLDPNRTTFTADSNDTTLNDYVVNPPVACFTTGTRIRTSRGEVAVEDLVAGDKAVTASGALRAITWIGHRQIGGQGYRLPDSQQPIRVQAGAFGRGLPARDLFLSPGHPVLVGADADNEGGALVPVMCLINGTSITREPRASVTYWHVELEAHDILLAEGLPAESYIDGGDRAFFVEASDHALHNPDFVAPGWNGRCRPVAVDGPLVEAERVRLDAVFAGVLSEQCDWEAAGIWVA